MKPDTTSTTLSAAIFYLLHNPSTLETLTTEIRTSFQTADSIGATWTQESVAAARSAFCAFSLGTRGCVGRRLAYKELQLSLALILFSFDLRLAEADQEPTSKAARHPMRWRKDEYQLFDRFLAERDGPMVEFRARQV